MQLYFWNNERDWHFQMNKSTPEAYMYHTRHNIWFTRVIVHMESYQIYNYPVHANKLCI